MDEKDLEPYRSNYSDEGLWEVLRRHAKRLGIKSVYTILLFYYAFQRHETPRWAKNIIVGVLGYLLTPIDLLPDLTPIIGYTDDLGLLSLGLVAIAGHINKDVREKARKKLADWFGSYDEKDITPVDDKL